MKHLKRGFVALTALLTVLFIVLSFLDRTQKMSIYEYRTLARAPAFSVQSLWDGSYFRGWDDYFSDHVYRRDDKMRAYQWLQLNVKHVVITRDVVITDDALLPVIPLVNTEGYDYTATARDAALRLADLQKAVEAQGSQFLYVGVDEQRTALADRYPPFVFSNSEHYESVYTHFRRACDDLGVHTLFMRDVLNDGADPLTYYSKVDHHFNYLGAYRTYRAICQTLAPTLGTFPIAQEEELGFYELPGEFYGAYNRRFYNLSPIREHLTVFDTSVMPPYTRWDNGKRTDAPLICIPEHWWDVSQYNDYMGGDMGETVVRTDRPELPSILIVGDSFTNPVEALSVFSFNEVRSLDFREYQEMTLTEYLALHPVDAVVVIRDNLNYDQKNENGDLK